MEWYSLEKDTAEIYEATGFADFRIYSDRGFNDADRDAVKAIDGVKDVSRFFAINTTVENDSDVIALSVSENMNMTEALKNRE